MIRDLPSTSSGAVVKELLRLRDSVGAMAMGRVLTLLVPVHEDEADAAIAAANAATRQHPARIIVLVTGYPRGSGRLDAQIRVGGDAGASEIVVLRLYGPLGKQLDSVVTPLLLPDSPIVAWWPGAAPIDVAASPLGQMAHRRITDAAAEGSTSGAAGNGGGRGSRTAGTALRRRARSYLAGDTDLAWTRITRWRALLAASLEGAPFDPVDTASVVAEPNAPSGDLLAAWLSASLRCPVARVRSAPGTGLVSVRLERASGAIDLVRSEDGTDTATLTRPGSLPRLVALHTPSLAEALAEELRRLDADEVYARALTDGLGQVRQGTTRSAAVRAGTVPEWPAQVEEAPTRSARGLGPRTASDDIVDAAKGSEVRLHPDRSTLTGAVVDELCKRLEEATDARGEAHVVLTGGSMGTSVMSELSRRARAGELAVQVWRRTHLWWGDERFVPSTHPDRNDGQADEAGLGHLPVLKKNIHRVPSGTGAGRLEAAAARYAADLASAALAAGTGATPVAAAGSADPPVPVPRFDVLMLGVGPDAHVASLFPGASLLAETTRTTAGVSDSPKPPPLRVTMTLTAINAARSVWLVVSGEDKRDAVRAALGAADDRALPASCVRGTGETVWWLDEAAAGR